MGAACYKGVLLFQHIFALQHQPHRVLVQLARLFHLFYVFNSLGRKFIAQVVEMQHLVLILRFQERDGRRDGQGQAPIVYPVAHILGRLGQTDDAVELTDRHSHLLGQLLVAVQFLSGGGVFLLPPGFLFHALHLAAQGSCEVIGGNMGAMQVAVIDQDLYIRVVEFLDDGRDRVVQFLGDHVAALARHDFQTAALRVDPGQDGVLYAVELNGLLQFPVVLAVFVHRDRVVFGLFQIAGVEDDKVGFPLLGTGQVVQRLIVRGRQSVLENLGDLCPSWALGGGTGHDGLGLYLALHRLLGSGSSGGSILSGDCLLGGVGGFAVRLALCFALGGLFFGFGSIRGRGGWRHRAFLGGGPILSGGGFLGGVSDLSVRLGLRLGLRLALGGLLLGLGSTGGGGGWRLLALLGGVGGLAVRLALGGFLPRLRCISGGRSRCHLTLLGGGAVLGGSCLLGGVGGLGVRLGLRLTLGGFLLGLRRISGRRRRRHLALLGGGAVLGGGGLLGGVSSLAVWFALCLTHGWLLGY